MKFASVSCWLTYAYWKGHVVKHNYVNQDVFNGYTRQLHVSAFTGHLQVVFKSAIYVKVKWNTNLMQHCAGFISAGSLYMFRVQAPETCRVSLQK